MTIEDKQALKEFLSGAGVVIGISAVLVVIVFVFFNQSVEETQKFKVVDEYKGCEVVRYAPDKTATYKYFLKCKDD